jgi:hypothetical protein
MHELDRGVEIARVEGAVHRPQDHLGFRHSRDATALRE